MTILAITSVLIMKENILFLEEWIDYHLAIGFDRIYLYDNSKVEIPSDFDKKNKWLVPQKRNKYNIDYDTIVKLTDVQMVELIEQIQQKYAGILFIIEWSPRNADGFVCYNQVEAHMDCLARLKQEKIDWCASIDIDEFIVLREKDMDIKKYTNQLDDSVTTVIMSQIRFDSRFNNIDRLITTIDKCEIGYLDLMFATKYIYRVNTTRETKIHSCYGSGKTVHPPLDELCFHHYKLDFSKPHSTFRLTDSIVCPDIVYLLQEKSAKYFRTAYASYCKGVKN